MRLRTLPVSISGVLAGTALAIWQERFSIVPAALCLLFAVSAQITSNFANEYYDYKNGMDRKGRDGFRRGVTEGDITPQAMRSATFVMLALAALTGCALLYIGEWWLLPVGICILLAALAYSAGPYPLSHHGLGDLAVVIFFGIVPVTLTYWLQTGGWSEIQSRRKPHLRRRSLWKPCPRRRSLRKPHLRRRSLWSLPRRRQRPLLWRPHCLW